MKSQKSQKRREHSKRPPKSLYTTLAKMNTRLAMTTSEQTLAIKAVEDQSKEVDIELSKAIKAVEDQMQSQSSEIEDHAWRIERLKLGVLKLIARRTWLGY